MKTNPKAIIARRGDGSGLGTSEFVVAVGAGGASQNYTVDVTRGAHEIAQIAYGKASNTGGNDGFGRRLAMSGDTLVVGARAEDSQSTVVGGDQGNNDSSNSGAVYVFRRHGSSWSQEAYIKGSTVDADDHFGHSVAISGDTLAVGVVGEDSQATGTGGDEADNTFSSSGAVFIFRREGSSWTQEAYLKASNTEQSDVYGFDGVALSGDTLAVGARDEASAAVGMDGDETDNSYEKAGAFYLYQWGYVLVRCPVCCPGSVLVSLLQLCDTGDMRVFVALLLPVFLGCACTSSLDVYTCTSDLDCGGMGFCEEARVCSFSDMECSGGRRYGKAAGDLAGQCVGGNSDANEGILAVLTGLGFLSTSVLQPAFDPSIFSYTLDVSILESEIRVVPTADSPTTILVNGVAVESGATSNPVSLDLGTNALVVAANGEESQNYTVAVTRGVHEIEQIAYGKASNTGGIDKFGHSLAI